MLTNTNLIIFFIVIYRLLANVFKLIDNTNNSYNITC